MMPRRVRIAVLLAFLCHGLFIVTGRYRLSYDAFTHMLFANHYAEHWFSLWETRWYAGFTVVSYPPLTHQLIALFIPVLGFDKAFALILWFVTSLYPLGIYAFSRIFTGKISASYAALASALLLPIYVTAHIFGQLPFLTSTLFALFSAASLNRYLREGGMHNFLLTVSLYTTTMAAHHATLLVQPFFILAIIAKNLFSHGATETQRKLNLRVFGSPWLTLRLVLFTLTTSLAGLLVIIPFWQWGTTQALQTPIDHLSRHNFLTDPLAPAIFLLPMYGPLLFIIPFLIRKWHPRFIGLLVAFIILFLLGLGGTTRLPQLFFGSAWEWLTYDRFAFWASLTLLPFFGIFFIWMKKKLRLIPYPIPASLRKNFIPTATFALFAATALGSWFTPYLFRLQPDPIHMQPIVDFLNTDNRSQYRYLTFGFGDQFAYLNLLTSATTIDGSYHTARELPELRASGIGQVDTSYWALNGMNAIVPILQKSGEHGIRWGFVNPKTLKAEKFRWSILHHNPYLPILEQLGWVKIKTLDNGVVVYENPNAILPQLTKPPQTKPIVAFAWGVFPILSLIITFSLAGLRIYHVQTKRINQAIYSLVVSIIPISLCFWISQPIAEFPHARVYFTYTNALFFFSDAIVVFAVILWLSIKITPLRITDYKSILHPSSFILAIILLSSFSTLWSSSPSISTYIFFHQFLLLLLILSFRDRPQVWTVMTFGLSSALAIEIITSFIGFAQQSTAFLDSFNMQFPGTLGPSIHGASVVQLANGIRILRAYGTLPHPNILGGLALIMLLGPASLYLEKQNRPALILFSLGLIVLTLTFSRSAWLGFLAFLAILILKSKYFDRKRIILFVSVCLVSMTLAIYPLRDLVFARVSNSPVATEQFSFIGRAWLAQQAFIMFQQHPLTGVGIGSFVVELSKHTITGEIVEPAHNIFLLAGSELGIVGLLVIAGLFIAIGINIYKAKSQRAILASATLTGLGVISLLDHYLWTVAPGRIMLALVLGLWLGQIEHDA